MSRYKKTHTKIIRKGVSIYKTDSSPFWFARIWINADKKYSVKSTKETLEKNGCEKIFQEKVSGTSTQGRNELKDCLEFVREGDELVIITRVDRLARSILDLQIIIKDLEKKGATLSATEQPISTKDATSKCFLDMLSVFSEFETNLRKERQMEGILKAKKKGVYKGRKPTIDNEKIRELAKQGLQKTAIAKELGIGRATVYRALEV